MVSLRRHCPDQVPGGRRPASELSPASQPFLPAPGLPGTPFGPAPSITSQTICTLHGADDGRLGPKARPARAKRRVSGGGRGRALSRIGRFPYAWDGYILTMSPRREPWSEIERTEEVAHRAVPLQGCGTGLFALNATYRSGMLPMRHWVSAGHAEEHVQLMALTGKEADQALARWQVLCACTRAGVAVLPRPRRQDYAGSATR